MLALAVDGGVVVESPGEVSLTEGKAKKGDSLAFPCPPVVSEGGMCRVDSTPTMMDAMDTDTGRTQNRSPVVPTGPVVSSTYGCIEEGGVVVSVEQGADEELMPSAPQSRRSSISSNPSGAEEVCTLAHF